MPIFKLPIFKLIAVALLLAVAASGASARDGIKYPSAQAAFEQGLGAYKAGYYEIAIPALEQAAEKGSESTRFFADFYLARIYADNAGAHTDHAKAYQLYLKLALDTDVDPEDGQRAPFVAKALTALAAYVRRGLPAIGLRPDSERAIEFLLTAANEFSDKDAQFELAKIYVSGSGDPEDIKRGVHYLSVLGEEGYPGAQALLADLLWRGKYVKKDERRALALISMAVENAPAHERVWIDDIYQNIYCATSQPTRKEANGIVAMWRKVFPRPAPPSNERMALGGGELQLQRLCKSGEVVDIRREAPAIALPPATVAAQPAAPASRDALQGSTAGFGLREVGVTGRPSR